VVNDPATATDGEVTADRRGILAERRRVVVAGHRGDAAAARGGLGHEDPGVRAMALGALARTGSIGVLDVLSGLGDDDPGVRRRACQVSVAVAGRGSRSALPAALGAATGDPDPLVAEAACWALGERRWRGAVGTLAGVATGHPDPRCREAAVAALGALGDVAGLPAVLECLGDKPAVRRRAVVALAGFAGPAVEEALEQARHDRDWQVRQAAEALIDP
jgi:HEAT repeat protein